MSAALVSSQARASAARVKPFAVSICGSSPSRDTVSSISSLSSSTQMARMLSLPFFQPAAGMRITAVVPSPMRLSIVSVPPHIFLRRSRTLRIPM